MSVGVIITRGQPIHAGHIAVIKQAIEENTKVLVILGSADKYGTTRNPFDVTFRTKLLEKALDKLDFTYKVSTMWLNDWSDDSDIPKQDNVNGVVDNPIDVSKEWGLYLYYSIVHKMNCKEFTLYYNDDTSIIDAWFPDFIRSRITVKSTERIGNFSSGAIREAMFKNDMKYLSEALPYLSKEEIIKLRYSLVTGKKVFL